VKIEISCFRINESGNGYLYSNLCQLIVNTSVKQGGTQVKHRLKKNKKYFYFYFYLFFVF
jgi:hypothetical protein